MTRSCMPFLGTFVVLSVATLAFADTRRLPDLFTFGDGRVVTTRSEWEERRQEMKDLLLNFQYGTMPPRPDSVTAEITETRRHDSDLGTDSRITLVIDSEHRLRMRIAVYVPDTDGPHPVVLREEGTLGRTAQIPMFLEKGYMFIEFARHDLDPDKQDVVGPAQQAYPVYDWATLAVWAWGGMRVVDYLETRADVDRSKIAITGHSRGGKMALLAGALDERFALVVPNGSGAGGAGAYRVLGPGAESLGMNDKPHWYHERIREFALREDRLPFDQHFLKALVAPRALLCTESVDDLFANPFGTQITSLAAHEAFELFNVPERNGLHFRRGEHDSTTADWQALLDFAEWHFFGREPANTARFWETPYPVPESLVLSVPRGGPGPAVTPAWREEVASTLVDFVAIGDLDNPPDANHFDQGRFGRVDHAYWMAVQKVTNAQYAEFLNAVAASDTHGLFHQSMQDDPRGGMERTGESGTYRYRPKQGMADHPVNFVSWHDAARYCNWLHHDRPESGRDHDVTASGAYHLTTSTAPPTRDASARYFLPTEDEWYKAAYYSASDGSYSQFPEGSTTPNLVGANNNGRSPHGAVGMNDGVWEWCETGVTPLHRGVRSGAWFQGNNRQAAGRFQSGTRTGGNRFSRGHQSTLNMPPVVPPRSSVTIIILGRIASCCPTA